MPEGWGLKERREAGGREETSNSEARLESMPFPTFKWLDELKSVTSGDRLFTQLLSFYFL